MSRLHANFWVFINDLPVATVMLPAHFFPLWLRFSYSLALDGTLQKICGKMVGYYDVFIPFQCFSSWRWLWDLTMFRISRYILWRCLLLSFKSNSTSVDRSCYFTALYPDKSSWCTVSLLILWTATHPLCVPEISDPQILSKSVPFWPFSL